MQGPIVICLLLLMIGNGKSGKLHCAQCNTRYMGVYHLCKEPRNATGCIGCLKSIAKVKLRDSGYIDGWERQSVFVSRLCITPGNTVMKPAGCYKTQSNGGYSERCFCYTDYCNAKAYRLHLDSSLTALSIFTFMARLSVPNGL